MAEAAIEFIGLTKHYGPTVALRDVSLRVGRGEMFGFLGPNGAGKTTAIRTAMDLIRPTGGRITVLGFDCQKEGVEARRHIGYLPGDLRMYGRMTAEQYLGLLASLRGGVDRRYRDGLVRRLDLTMDRPIGTLSRGNQQKVGLVVALMARPEVAILDEPTSGLDPLMQETIHDVLRQATADGATVFFSSHVLAEVEELCHRVALLRQGRLVDVLDLAERRRLAPLLVEVEFGMRAPEVKQPLPGATVASRDGNRTVFEVTNSIDALVKWLASYEVVRLETRRPTLEDLFMSYYGEPEGALKS